MQNRIRTVSPVNGAIIVERPFGTLKEAEETLAQARLAGRAWARRSLPERQEICRRAIDRVLAEKARLADSLTWQMGRPLSQAGGELDGFAERGLYMIEAGAQALQDIVIEDSPTLTRAMRKVALGVVFIVAPWNYPYLTVVNSLIPALLAGNAVLLKPSPQTPLVAEDLVSLFREAGLPEGVFSYVHLDPQDTLAIISKGNIDGVAFTGSVENGRRVEEAAAGRFLPVGLELGGKDPAYVREDADLDPAADGLVEGAFFNSGQSCCGIERIYVHEAVYGRFVEKFMAGVGKYRLGNPFDAAVTLGPVVSAAAARRISAQVREALAAGARNLILQEGFPEAGDDAAYLAPAVLVDVTHDMAVMREETFGPVVGIMKVGGDEQAVSLMNDSPYGLTASVWSRDVAAAWTIGEQLETGSVFLNRCDYLDPALAWTGVKNSGRGCSLSRFGFDQLTRLKSFHLRKY